LGWGREWLSDLTNDPQFCCSPLVWSLSMGRIARVRGWLVLVVARLTRWPADFGPGALLLGLACVVTLLALFSAPARAGLGRSWDFSCGAT
jgi:hypothetical protein